MMEEIEMICKKFVIFFGNNVILCNPHITIRSGFFPFLWRFTLGFPLDIP